MVKLMIDYDESEREFSGSSAQIDAFVSDLSAAVRASTLRPGFMVLVISAFAQRLLYDVRDPLLDKLDDEDLLCRTITHIADSFEPLARAH